VGVTIISVEDKLAEDDKLKLLTHLVKPTHIKKERGTAIPAKQTS
jgi:hypothetical protein